MKKPIISAILILLTAFTVTADLVPASQVEAATKTLDITTAVRTALSYSDEYEEVQNDISLQEIKYQSSVKKLRLKKKRQESFSWSPLLSFKLPEKADISDETSYEYTPLELSAKIEQLDHKKSDTVYSVYEETELLFVTCYQLQEQISYNEDRLESAKTSLKKNKAKLLIGQATQTDIDTIEKKISTIESSLTSDKRNLEANKTKLSDAMGIDLSIGYKFKSPFITAEIDRDDLEDIIDATLDSDDSYYQTCVTTQNALLALNTNYDNMKDQYGGDMSIIDSFINTAKNGGTVKKSAFKKAYNSFLEKIDEPWQGNYKIFWFIQIPKEWLKGEIDGIRYVEDEPYVLFESALEYSNDLKEQNTAKSELTQSVRDSYENYISALNAVESTEESLAEKKVELKKAKTLNADGKMTFEEYNTVQEDYEQLQLDLISAKADLSTILYSFDRLSCGKVSEYITGDGITLTAASGGSSYVVEEDDQPGIYYYIRQLASSSVFEVGLSVSDDYDTDIDSFELYIDDEQVGTKTQIGEVIRHLTFETDGASKVIVRLYSGDTFVDDCEIDPQVYSDRLTITNYHIETDEETAVASYTAETTSSGFMKLKITPLEGQAISTFTIKDSDGKYLISSKKTSVNDSFTYLGAAKNSLSQLTVEFYDSTGTLLYQGSFNTSDNTIYKKSE